MEPSSIAIEAEPSLIADLRAEEEPGIIVGETTRTQSPVEALSTTISADDVKHIAEACVVVLQAAGALTGFIAKLMKALRKRPGATAVIRDPKTRRVKGKATHKTTEVELRKMLES